MIVSLFKRFFSELFFLKNFVPKQISELKRTYIFDPTLWLLIVIFALIFGPFVFMMLEDVDLLTALEVDPGSIIRSINDLYKWPFYSMFNGYHSQYYGWTFFAINFFTALPAKLLAAITMSHSQTLINLSIRMTLFIIGLFSVVVSYVVMNIFLK